MFESRLEYRASQVVMAAPEPSWAGYIGTALQALIVPMGLGLWRFISSKASKQELADAIRSAEKQTEALLERVDNHYDEARESRERLYDKFDNFAREINKTLGATMVSLSRLQGQLDREDDERRRSR